MSQSSKRKEIRNRLVCWKKQNKARKQMINKKQEVIDMKKKREWGKGVSKGEAHLEATPHFLLRSRGGASCLRAGDRWSRLYDDVKVGSRGKVLKGQKVGQCLKYSDGGQ